MKRKNKADWVLMCWLMALAIHLGFYYLDSTEMIGNYGFMIGLSIPFPLLHGPFLFIYTTLLLNPNKKISSYWIHFLPFGILNLFLIPFYRLPSIEKLFIFQNEGVGYENFVIINAILIYLSGIIYFTLSAILIHKHKKKIKNNFSQIEGKTLDWLRFLTIGIGVIWAFVLVGNNELIFSGVALFIILIGVFGVRQSDIFSNPRDYLTKEVSANLENLKYQNSGLSDENKATLVKQLEEVIRAEKPFLDPELSLNQLAKMTGAQPNYISQILNEHFEMNFYDFINSKRVDEFCEILDEGQFKNYKIVEIAYKCGFNSKSTFNRNFKKFKGMTPSKYKNDKDDVSSGKITPETSKP